MTAATKPPRPLIAGNWKMNGLLAALAEVRALAGRLARSGKTGADLLLCPPATLLHPMAQALSGSAIALGGQDCHAEPKGAHTGDIAAEMLADLGCRYVIVGHSERRQNHGETDAEVAAKATAAQRAGLTAIVCVGETRAEREAGRAEAVVTAQLLASLPAGCTDRNTVIAYEPVWAIGTGLTPTAADVAALHAAIRRVLGQRFGAAAGCMRLLYGGSVKAGNAAELLAVANVDGALVGGASLSATEFWPIVEARL
ncbi:MAG: triose-phosphate isomerase [Alphaproteobacteria bacterium]|nr:triose-phosphate isomerase [Alphaproteobacteria bacterium]